MSTVCRRCKAPIVWARTENGRPMPLDAELDANGNVATYSHDGELVAVLVPTAVLERLDARPRELYRPHFATCPYADEFRRRP